MLTERQCLILNSCADDWEIFYFPFARVNYGPSPAGAQAEAIAADLVVLVAHGFLQCARLESGTFKRKMLESISTGDLSMYAGYSCLTFDDHIATYGYGPHEFYITETGVTEIHAPEYAIWYEGWRAEQP